MTTKKTPAELNAGDLLVSIDGAPLREEPATIVSSVLKDGVYDITWTRYGETHTFALLRNAAVWVAE